MNYNKYIKTYYPAVIIFLALVAFSFFAYNEANVIRKDRRSQLFELRVQRVNETIRNRMIDYTQILKGCQGLFYASDSVTLHDWKVYTESLAVADNYPGIQALAYSRYVSKEMIGDFEKSIRDDRQDSFTIKSTNKNKILTPVVYIEPLTIRNSKALGFDLSSDPIRKKAIDRAIATGKAALTSKIKLVQETNENVQPGLLMFLPIYKAGSRNLKVNVKREVVGLVSNVFRAHDLMNALLKRFTDIDIEIYDKDSIGEKYLLFDSNNILQAHRQKDDDLYAYSSILIGGTTWRLFINPNVNFDTALESLQPLLILASGLLISFLIFILAMNSIRRRSWIVEQLELSKQIESKKDEFIGIASHELKTPLTSIKAYIQLLERTNLKDKELQYVKKASSQIKKLSGLISDLLDVSKIQAGKLQLNVTSFLLSELINDSVESVEHMYTSHFIAKPDVIPEVLIHGDKFRLEQALTNFLVNAIKYSPDKNKVHVNTKVSKYEITIEVIDDGIGISKENQQRIFDRFFRAEELLPSMSGLGIGLYISNEIVKRHKGNIGVRSELNKGSTFYLSLPREVDGSF